MREDSAVNIVNRAGYEATQILDPTMILVEIDGENNCCRYMKKDMCCFINLMPIMKWMNMQSNLRIKRG